MTVATDEPDRPFGPDDVTSKDVEPDQGPQDKLQGTRGSIDMDRAARYVEILDKLKTLTDEESTLKEEKRKLEQDILDDFERTGSNNFTVTVGKLRRTIFMRRDLAVSPTDNRGVVTWFQDNGLADKVRVLSQSLSALVREYDERGEDLPAALAEKVKVTELFTVRSRKA